jgi:hypothetical protein
MLNTLIWFWRMTFKIISTLSSLEALPYLAKTPFIADFTFLDIFDALYFLAADTSG